MTQGLPVLALLAAMVASTAGATDDDDLAPLTPVKPKVRPALPPRRPVAPPRRVLPAPVSRPDDELAPLTPLVLKGELLVRVAGGVQGAVLLVDGRELVALPAGRQSLPVGEHLVTVRRPGFSPFTRRVTLGAGRVVEVEARLSPSAAVLSVRTDVPDAQVTVNGRLVGTTPLPELEVPPGAVDLVVSRAGYLEERQHLVTVAGREYPVTLRLVPVPGLREPPADAPVERSLAPAVSEPGSPLALAERSAASPPVTQRWYFWAGVVVAVAAAAAGTALAVTAAQPPRARSAGDVCQGPCDACIGLSCVARPAGGSF
jgi:hypothetical protein